MDIETINTMSEIMGRLEINGKDREETKIAEIRFI